MGYTGGTMKGALLAAALALATLTPAPLVGQDLPGDRKIRDTIGRAREAEERAREKETPQESEDEEGGGGLAGAIVGAFFQAFFEAVFELAPTLRFADYPYDPGASYVHNTSTLLRPDERKWFSVQLSSDAAAHLDGTWGNSNRALMQLAGLHINFYQLQVLSESESLSAVSLNGGLTFFMPGFLLSGFAGAWTLDALEAAYPSCGFSCQVFLPGRVHLDVYNLNAFVGAEVWGHLEGTLEYQLWRLALGAGWRYTLIAGSVFQGPCLRASLWL
jgi:hypothetical protein